MAIHWSVSITLNISIVQCTGSLYAQPVVPLGE